MVSSNSIAMIAQKTDPQMVLGRETFLFEVEELPQSLGVLLYAFEGISMYMPLRKTYYKKTNFHSFYIGAMVFISLGIFAVNVPNYYNFYDITKEIIFLNFNNKFMILYLLKIVYMFMIFLSNPINLFPIYRSISEMSNIQALFERKSKSFIAVFKFTMRMLVTLLCILVACAIPSFIGFISFAGSFFFSLLGIVIPTLLYISHFSNIKKLGVLDGIVKGIMLILSMTLFCISVGFSFKSLISNK